MKARHPPATRGFTLVELMVVVALVAVVLSLAAPSLRDMVQVQRLRSTSAQVVTDVQYARSEAASRQRYVYVDFKPNAAAMSCYIVHTCGGANGGSPGDTGAGRCTCDCAAAEGSRCTAAGAKEIKTVQVKSELSVKVAPVARAGLTPEVIVFDPATGGMVWLYTGPLASSPPQISEAWIETSLIRPNSAPSLRAVIAQTGRPSVCTPTGRVSGVDAC